ncbi:hypothetical protein [Psychromonas aquimarina]|uniref:hypothetical protein n=1 Tax=Psychromonas aquimarina TaxID=444919 RepID=UPI000402947E|nr:hypothetical protein [Psychromonas aquimarina]
MKLRNIITSLTLVLLTACASTSNEAVKTNPFSTNNSHAMNLALQTELMTNESPLRDFEQGEIDTVKEALRKSKGGASKFFGTLNVLTGDFTGLIDIAGGYSADLALSEKHHASSNSRWLVSVDSSEYKNEVEATNAIRSNIRFAVTKVFSKYGEVKEIENKNGNYLIIESNGESYGIGTFTRNKQTPAKLMNVDFTGNGVIESYTSGVDSNKIINPIYLEVSILLDTLKTTKQDVLLKEITDLLPSGYYYYRPSFEISYGLNKSKYVNYNALVPAIYTQGQRYDFIKPE